MRTLKFFQVINNTKVLYKLLKSPTLVPGQLRNLSVKIVQIEPLTLAKYWAKLNFFFEKISILHTIIHLKSLHFTKMTLGTSKLVLKGNCFGLKTSPIYTVIEYFVLCPSVRGVPSHGDPSRGVPNQGYPAEGTQIRGTKTRYTQTVRTCSCMNAQKFIIVQ